MRVVVCITPRSIAIEKRPLSIVSSKAAGRPYRSRLGRRGDTGEDRAQHTDDQG